MKRADVSGDVVGNYDDVAVFQVLVVFQRHLPRQPSPRSSCLDTSWEVGIYLWKHLSEFQSHIEHLAV